MRHIGEGQRGAARFFVVMLTLCACLAHHSPGYAAPPSPDAAQKPDGSQPTPQKPDVNKPDTPPADAAAGQTFAVMEYRVLGNTSLPSIDVERAVYPFLGPQRAMKDIEAARAELEKTYHDKGFGTVFVDIPEQSVEDGIVRLHVTEGRLRKVTVSGERYFSGREIKSQLPSAQQGTITNLPQLQKELLALNTQTPDRAVVPVLRAGPVPGTVDLDLKVQDHLPFHGSVELNNQQTPDTKPLRTLATLSYDDLFGSLDHFGLQYQGSPQAHSQVEVGVLSYVARVSARGLLSFSFIDSDSNVATLGTLGVIGKGKIYGLHYTQMLQTSPATADSPATSHSVTFGADYKDMKQSILTAPESSLNTPIAYINWSASYNASIRTRAQQWGFDLTGNFGIHGLANRTQDFANKRFNASPDYFYLRSDASVLSNLPWHFSGLIRLSGQYSAEPLINNEQFVVGGVDTVRGYLEAENLGDLGAHATVQLNSPELALFGRRLRFMNFVFFDAARVSTIDPLPGEPINGVLRSAGAGLNIIFMDQFTGVVTWADPLVEGPRTRSGDSRLLFSVRGTW
jgi:hemolysin activation/secretion protein